MHYFSHPSCYLTGLLGLSIFSSPLAGALDPNAPFPIAAPATPAPALVDGHDRLAEGLALLASPPDLGDQNTAPNKPTGPEPEGATVNRARLSGHWTNYDEAKVPSYTLPDPLVFKNGQPVKTPEDWVKRRPEILQDFATYIYGRIPANHLKVAWGEPMVTNNGMTITKSVSARITDDAIPAPASNAPTADQIQQINAALKTLLAQDAGAKTVVDNYPAFNPIAAPPAAAGPSVTISFSYTIPANAPGPVPVIFEVGGGASPQLLSLGWGYGTMGSGSSQTETDILGIKPDAGIMGMILQEKGQTARNPDDGGVMAAEAWSMSRVLDYLETDPLVDVKQLGITGHSRNGKAALVAAAYDQRWAIAWPSCGGAMGTSLAHRGVGETVDNIVGNPTEGAWMALNFARYVGHWNEMPVDQHELIALVAPRPVFVNAGTTDMWEDPVGAFYAAKAAGPVFKLLGQGDLGATEMPPPATPLITGGVAYYEHVGGHTQPAEDWAAFMEFAQKYIHAPVAK